VREEYVAVRRRVVVCASRASFIRAKPTAENSHGERPKPHVPLSSPQSGCSQRRRVVHW
jgi:hypothetical protein